MSARPDVSVIVPSYDHEAFVVAAVESALGQDGVSVEVIAIDDGSNDRSAELLAGIRDERLRVVRQENRGLSRTLNRGLEMANGHAGFGIPEFSITGDSRIRGDRAVVEMALGLLPPIQKSFREIAGTDP